jgi:hypothetical protein
MKGAIGSLALVVLFAAAAVAAAPVTATLPLIPDDEEYAVFGAVLFPNKPEIPANVQDEALYMLKYRDRVRLDGIQGGPYMVAEGTARERRLEPRDAPEGRDAAMLADYNAKNATAHRLDGAKLSRLGPTRHVTMIAEDEIARLFGPGRGWEEFRQRFPFEGGIVRFSRVGFNEDKTRAVVHVGCQADYEMGVAYLVFLEKSAKTGNWLLLGTMLTRIS